MMARTFYWLIPALILISSGKPYAEISWASFTLDNDVFLGDDSGYTNGVFLSAYDIESNGPTYLLMPLLWSINSEDSLAQVDAYTLGQIMVTPEDITKEVPGEDDVPYAGVLFFENSFLSVNAGHTDKIGIAIGVVGPSSGAEETQKLVHELTGSDEPLGWDTQIEDEIIFQLSRGRGWRTWVSDDSNTDFITSSEFRIGNFETSLRGAAVWRYGRNLIESYPSLLLSASRTSNPVAVQGGWYVYAGFLGSVTFNTILADGNSFRDSDSIEYDPIQAGYLLGAAYSWNCCSLTFGVSDGTWLDENLERVTRYGTLTFAFRL